MYRQELAIQSMTKRVSPTLYYKARTTINKASDTNAHHTPKARYMNAGHRHTTTTTTKHLKDEQNETAKSRRRTPPRGAIVREDV